MQWRSQVITREVVMYAKALGKTFIGARLSIRVRSEWPPTDRIFFDQLFHPGYRLVQDTEEHIVARSRSRQKIPGIYFTSLQTNRQTPSTSSLNPLYPSATSQ
jgi:hypothetical protein